jgi:small-conductance mechanosensitive channel
VADQPTPQTNDAELDQWVADHLRERGLDPQSLTLEQMVTLMQEAVQTIIAKLQDASQEAGDLAISQELQALVDQAEELHQDLTKLHTEVGAEVRSPGSEVRSPEPEAGSPESEVRGPRSEGESPQREGDRPG